MAKQDLTQYPSGALSEWVFNDEGLYIIRHKSFDDELLPVLDELFTYNAEQLQELKDDLAADLEEVENK